MIEGVIEEARVHIIRVTGIGEDEEIDFVVLAINAATNLLVGFYLMVLTLGTAFVGYQALYDAFCWLVGVRGKTVFDVCFHFSIAMQCIYTSYRMIPDLLDKLDD